MASSSNSPSDPSPAAVRTVIYDGSADGFLCAADWVLTHLDERPVLFSTMGAHTDDLFAPQAQQIHTDAKQADTFYRNLQKHGSKQAARNVMFALMAMDAPHETLLLGYVRKLLRCGAAVDKLHADPDVACVHRYARKVGSEIHRFKGLLRFSQLAGGRLLAIYEPDYDITLFLAWHFARRLRSQSWIILDARRQAAAIRDGAEGKAEDARIRMLTGPALQQLLQACEPDPGDQLIQQQWQAFYRSVAIENRTNPALRRRSMPVRYWKHLTELDPSVR